MGWGDPGFMGNEVIRTPALDAMAAAGLRFDRFYAASPVCSPTRGSCITGRHPERYGILTANSGHLPRRELTLAELLGARGYATGHFGKWHLGTLTRTERDSRRGGTRHAEHYSPPSQHGYEVCFATEAKVPTWDPAIRPRGWKDPWWWDPVEDPAQAEPFGTAFWNERGQRVTANLEGDSSRVLMDRVIPFVRRAARSGRPFFATVWFFAPHEPLVAGPPHSEAYADLPVDRHHRYYYAAVSALDEQLGRLRDELRALGVERDTILWFCSDNGPARPETYPGSAGPLRGGKGQLFEGGVRVPAVLEWPARVQPGTASAVPASTLDLLPTVLAAVGLALPDGRPLDGISLLPLLDGEGAARRRPIPFQYFDERALIDGRHKLIVYPEGGRHEAGTFLYDLEADPAESRDLAAELPERVGELLAAHGEWRRSVEASLQGRDYP